MSDANKTLHMQTFMLASTQARNGSPTLLNEIEAALESGQITTLIWKGKTYLIRPMGKDVVPNRTVEEDLNTWAYRASKGISSKFVEGTQ